MKRKTHANELQNNFDRVSIVMSKKEAVAMIASMTQRKKRHWENNKSTYEFIVLHRIHIRAMNCILDE